MISMWNNCRYRDIMDVLVESGNFEVYEEKSIILEEA